MKKKKVLVTFVEAGMGHIVTAQAVADALSKCGEEIEVIRENIFHSNEVLKKYEGFLINETKKASSRPLHSRFQIMSMHIIGAQNSLKFVNGCVFKKQRDLYIEELKRIKPDIIVDTYFFTAYCSVTYRNKYNPNCKVITYDPDNNVHGWWDKRVDMFIVNNPTALKEAIKVRKFDKDKVKCASFVARDIIVNDNGTKEEYRKKNNIPLNQFVVKLADGMYGRAKMRSYIYELIKSPKPMTIIAIAGKNEELLKELNELKQRVPKNINLIPYGFVENINELIRASDLFITKAGPNAVLDSVFLQTPIMINYYANNIEHTTRKVFVDDGGCGVCIKNKKKARAFVERCIDDPSILKPYIENEKTKFDKSINGSELVADLIMNNYILNKSKTKNKK
ncbi:MAG: hypothetical protein J6T74_04635 [Clostridia bacterium]|nr:hypothetical protein [Clostridia bacterium]